MGALTARNLRVFFRDRTAVIMSLFADLILIALYALFLGDQLTEGMDFDGAQDIVNSWVISGIIAVTTMTSTLGGLGIMVEDRADGVERDFLVSPIRRSAMAGAYAISSFCTGAILSLCTFLVGEFYIVATGGPALTGEDVLRVVLGILLSVASSGAIVLFITSFLRSNSAYSMVSLVVGVMIGFITGVYIPIGALSDGVATVVKTFPVSYSASYFRQILTREPIDAAAAGAPGLAEELREDLGVFFNFDGVLTTMQTTIWVMVVTAVVFFALTWINFSVKRKTVT